MIYRTIQASERSALDNEVNWYLQNGWKLQGGVCATVVHATSSHYTYTQAIVKEN